MPERIAAGKTFETDTRVAVNVTGQPIYVCDCCFVRKHYVTLAAVTAHEDASASRDRAYSY